MHYADALQCSAADGSIQLALVGGSKAQLEEEARREGTSLSALLDNITRTWLNEKRIGIPDNDPEQAAIRRRAAAAIGTIRGGDPTFASRASELVREIIVCKHEKEARVSRRAR